MLDFQIEINGKLCDEYTKTDIEILFKDYINRDIEEVINNVKKILKKYDEIDTVSIIVIDYDNEKYMHSKKIVNGVKYHFNTKTKDIYSKDDDFIEYKGYTEKEYKKMKNDLIDDILILYLDTQKRYIEKLYKQSQEVV